MKREEAKEKLTKANSGSTPYNAGIKKANTRAKYVITQIYNDFESRTCENCKYFTTPQYSFSVCKKIGNVTVPKDFGCNKYEQRT